MPGIDVLDVNRAPRPHAGPDVDCLMGDAGFYREVAIHPGAVADEQHVGRQYRPQELAQLRRGDGTASRMKVQRLTAAIARDEQAIVLAADPAPPGNADAQPTATQSGPAP